MPKTDPNIEALRSMPQWGTYLYKAFKVLLRQTGDIASQTNSALDGSESAPPPAVSKLLVSASGGVAHLQAVHNVPIYRGVNYHFHVSGDGGSTWSTLYSGPNRDVRLPVGTGSLHYAVTCDYPTSPASPVTYYTAGGSSPAAVAASGASQPEFPAGQGSGTGFPGQIAGYGPTAWRDAQPPRRA